MNRFIATALIAVSASFAGQVFADDITPAEPFTSTRDRVEVIAELAQSRTAANPWSIAYDPLAGFKSSRSAADVRAEYIPSRDQVADLTGEDSGSFTLPQTQPTGMQLAGQPVNAQ
jgi:hypothetical protein